MKKIIILLIALVILPINSAQGAESGACGAKSGADCCRIELHQVAREEKRNSRKPLLLRR